MPRPLTLPWDISTFVGNEPVTTLSDNFSSLKNAINDSGDGWSNYAVDTGSVNAYVLTLASAPAAYSAGMLVFFKPINTNTTTSTININSVGSVSILTPAGNALLGGEIVVNQVIGIVFDGTNFRIHGPCPAIKSQSSATTITLECAGCTSVEVNASFTVTGQLVSLSHVGPGVPVSIVINNLVGSTASFAVQISDASGTNYSNIQAVIAGGVGLLASIQNGVGSLSLLNGQSRVFTGISNVGFIRFT